MTEHAEKAPRPAKIIALVGMYCIAFDVLMGTRGMFEPAWIKVALGACAYAFLGLAVCTAQWYRKRRNALELRRPDPTIASGRDGQNSG